MQKQEDQDWDLVIKGRSSLFDLRLGELWNYRDLLVMFVKRDFVSFYKQTILGPLWFFIQPIFTTIVFSFVFGNLAGISTDGAPKYLFYLTGITSWAYFSDCLTKTSTVFKDNASIFGKVYFPRLIMPLSIVVSNLVRFGVQLSLLLCMMTYFYIFPMKGSSFHVTSALVLFPFLVILMALLGLGLGLIITAMTTKYRDLTFLVTFGVQLLMYATPVIYPLSYAREKGYATLVELNPMTGIIETFRYAFIGTGEFNLLSLGYSALITLLILVIGVIIFNKTEKNFVDTI
ncbi:ABC transporter permease [Flavobacterium aquatile]|uniref:Transport permease protein n=1 Tax=Flavobacterium aquatile LMG 4008 = ATCC 11947 TaxID=1453498 RepID=A0A095U0M2_9FLAO|nr:ABC transporter permease [Flavobacterium aquatile]KGD68133.1 ABC transporter permease [Flavobacterium aquatile LMG 4008 = ATCC 11947]OXA68932.1 ABC transporter permease [Flavobacterium aquatile LMG 4008 = ATCC 11947]GEC77400.1 transport permease protein [Flavobacterium aquatile]